MYLHLGQGTVVKTEDIIGIFDLDSASISKRTRAYLAKAEKNNQVINVSQELPKSFIICANGSDQKIYLSQLSSATLSKRYKSQTS